MIFFLTVLFLMVWSAKKLKLQNIKDFLKGRPAKFYDQV